MDELVGFKDCNGAVIKQGDSIVVAQRRGSRSWLAFYNVIGLDSNKGNRPIYKSKNNRSITYGGANRAIWAL